MKKSFSLKTTNKTKDYNTRDVLQTIEDLQNGKKGAADKLAKYVGEGKLNIETYKELIAKYGSNIEEKQDTKRSQKIKHMLCSIVAVLVLLSSMLCTLGQVVVHHGKGVAFFYFFLWFWAIFYDIKTKKDS